MRSHALQADTSPVPFTCWASIKRVLPLMLGIFLNVNTLTAQQVDRGADGDEQTIKALLGKIEQLEAVQKQLQDRVTQLEKAQRGLARDSIIQSPAPGAVEKAQQTLAQDSGAQSPGHFGMASETLAGAQGGEASPERIEENKTLLNIRGFADYSFHGATQKRTSTSFSRGLLRVFNTPGFYTQISQGFGSFRPYFRYQYVNAPGNDPIFLPVCDIPVGLQYGPSLGLRYDFSESVATKLQYDFTDLRRLQGITQLAISQLDLQLTFAF